MQSVTAYFADVQMTNSDLWKAITTSAAEEDIEDVLQPHDSSMEADEPSAGDDEDDELPWDIIAIAIGTCVLVLAVAIIIALCLSGYVSKLFYKSVPILHSS